MFSLRCPSSGVRAGTCAAFVLAQSPARPLDICGPTPALPMHTPVVQNRFAGLGKVARTRSHGYLAADRPTDVLRPGAVVLVHWYLSYRVWWRHSIEAVLPVSAVSRRRGLR